MAVDKYSTDWHLTPNGWIEGEYRYFNTVREVIPPPPDRVLTMREEVTESFALAGESKESYEVWRAKHITDAELAELQKKHGYR